MSRRIKVIKEIHIRGIPPEDLAVLDEMAVKKGITRNELIKQILHSVAISEDIQNIENRNTQTLEALIEVLQNNTEVLNRVDSFMSSMYNNLDN